LASADISRTLKARKLIISEALLSILIQKIPPIHSGAEYLFLAGCLLIALKLIATVVHVALSQGDFRSQPDTALFRVAYFTGKVTPAMAAGCLCASALLRHDQKHSWEYAALAVVAAFLAVFVIRLRKRGRFFGVFHLLSKRQENR
jgi:predicted MFS family arabinose efflux permease